MGYYSELDIQRQVIEAHVALVAPEMLDALEEAEKCLGTMIFMAEAAQEHGIAAGDITRAAMCLSEIQNILQRMERQ